jgi:ribonuclease R
MGFNEEMDQKILEILSSKDVVPLYAEQLIHELDLSESEEEILLDRLDEMVKVGKLVRTKKKKYALPEDLGFLSGRLQGHAKGFGFFIPDNKDEDDVFISAENIHGAMHNDRIMIRLLKSEGKSREGEIVKILERANRTVVGTFEKDKYFGFVVPDDKRIIQDIFIPKDEINGICSLNPQVDRLTFSVFMEIDNEGKVLNHRIEESVIRSSERMTYEDVTKILEENDSELIERYSHLVEDFRNMDELSKILRKKRMRRGSIDFDLDETKIILDIKGKPIDVQPYERGVSNKIIEEFMLVCNETVAEYMTWNEVPFLYRIHEEPTLEKLLDFNEFIHRFGYNLKGIGGKVHPKSLQQLLDQIRGSKEEGIISTVMLRSLQKAKYSSDNAGHFGLAAQYYSHFTAPIRRYPDLIIHRIIKDFINGRIDNKKIKKLEKRLPEMADHCSQRERLADEAERETDDLKKAEYMQDKIGMEFDGIISGVTNYGIYVQLYNTVEGLVRMTALDDDYYVYNEKHYCLIGERTRKVYRLGDTIRIRVSHVDLAARNIDFVLA